VLTYYIDASAPGSLLQNLAARQRLVEIVFADGIEEFMRSFRSVQVFLNDTFCLLTPIRLIKHNATSGNSTSYMLAYMRPVYKVGQRDSGTWTFSPIPARY
jgi:hypothetical protein